MTKPTTKSPTERRLRKHIRELLTVYEADPKRNADNIVREFLALIDDEVRRTRMSMPYRVDWEAPVSVTPKHIKKAIGLAIHDGSFDAYLGR